MKRFWLIALALFGMNASAQAGEWKDPLTAVLQNLGLEQEDPPYIEYRERPPLVLPPSAELREPVTTAHETNPNWPKDPDAERRNAEKLANKTPIDQRRGDPTRPLTRDELRRGAIPGAGRATGTALREPGDSTRDVLMPDELGAPRWGIFGTKKAEAEVFKGEPQRHELTEPPTGYRTPSPDQPWQAPPKKTLFGSENFFDRTAK